MRVVILMRLKLSYDKKMETAKIALTHRRVKLLYVATVNKVKDYVDANNNERVFTEYELVKDRRW